MYVREFEERGLVLVRGLLEKEKENLSEWANEVPLLGEVVYEKGNITRCENFVDKHAGFASVTNGKIAAICGELFGESQPAALFKEKLNYKPPGGFGFVPHLDHPSLQFYAPPNYNAFITVLFLSFSFAFFESLFVQVMVAIDAMTLANGCLRLAPGPWTRDNAVVCVEPEGDPEVGGRAGGIQEKELENLQFEAVECLPGDVLFFNGYVTLLFLLLFSSRSLFFFFRFRIARDRIRRKGIDGRCFSPTIRTHMGTFATSIIAISTTSEPPGKVLFLFC
jgi:hypothetical protein